MEGRKDRRERSRGVPRESASGFTSGRRGSLRQSRSVRETGPCHAAGENASNLEEFWEIAGYLDEKGWIAEADADYGVFALTPEGIDAAVD